MLAVIEYVLINKLTALYLYITCLENQASVLLHINAALPGL